MAKVKIQKKDIWIDMTPMSDVMTLLLCFFMCQSLFRSPHRVLCLRRKCLRLTF